MRKGIELVESRGPIEKVIDMSFECIQGPSQPVVGGKGKEDYKMTKKGRVSVL
jgi:hypothetical protein